MSFTPETLRRDRNMKFYSFCPFRRQESDKYFLSSISLISLSFTIRPIRTLQAYQSWRTLNYQGSHSRNECSLIICQQDMIQGLCWLITSFTCSKTGTFVAAMDVFIQAWPPFIAVRTVRILYALHGKGLFGVRARNACLLEAFFSWIHLAGCHAWFAASESCWTCWFWPC